MKNLFKQTSFIGLFVLFTMNFSSMAQTFKSINEIKGIEPGTKVTMFSALDVNGNQFHLKDALKKGPVVLLFYRGQWCPVCNRYLSQIQDSLQQIYSMGASVIAISPEKPELLKKTKAKTKADFILLHDKDFKIGEAFDVVFMPDEKLVRLYNERLNAHLEESSSDGTARLPVPATFIIDKNGVVVWKQFNPDYKIRASAKEIIDNIPKS